MNITQNEIILFKDGELELNVSLDQENRTVWLSQKDMATLFGTNTQDITKHIKNIYKSNELAEKNSALHINNSQIINYSTLVAITVMIA